jgi:GNAT superfamily N-acetyltransferase
VATIRTANDGDISTLARTYWRAFADDPVMRWLFPDDDDYADQGLAIFATLARRWLAHGTLWCTDDGVAVAGWNPPGRPEADVEDPNPVDHPAWRIERFVALGTAIDANTPDELHWHLNMIGTHPDWQRNGLAGSLMATTFEIADAAGLPCYLETETVENVAYYRRFGFEVRTEWDVEVPGAPGPHMWGMLRPVQGA